MENITHNLSTRGYDEANLRTNKTIETLGTMSIAIEQDRQTVSILSADNGSLKRQFQALSTQLVSLQANGIQNRQGTSNRTILTPRTTRRFKNDHYC